MTLTPFSIFSLGMGRGRTALDSSSTVLACTVYSPARVMNMLPLHADPVADVQDLDQLEGGFAHGVPAEHDLHAAHVVLQVDEGQLALEVVPHDASREGDLGAGGRGSGFAFGRGRRKQRFLGGQQGGAVVGGGEAVRIGIDAHLPQLAELFQPGFDLIIHFHRAFPYSCAIVGRGIAAWQVPFRRSSSAASR